MYHAATSLTPPLPPEEFWTAQAWDLERAGVFWESWHLVGTAGSLRKPGDYLSCQLLGVPVVVRNFDGQLVALRNVCAHRQAILATKPQGHSSVLKCPYHGWEYGADGRTRKLPGATNFPHFDHKQYCLDRFAVEQCGELVFVKLGADGPSLREWLGSRFSMFEEWFTPPAYLETFVFTKEYPSNWKIPVDISLESYHIPWVHEKTFHSDPGDELSEHEFFENGSSLHTKLLEPRLVDNLLRTVERFEMAMMGVPFEDGYQHHHVAPNLMISRTCSLSLAQFVHPHGPDSSHVLGVQFRRGAARNNPLSRFCSWGWGKFTAQLTWMILHEDLGMYSLVQQGVRGAARPGLLGRCEERLHHYHQMVRQRVDAEAVRRAQKLAGLPATAGESANGCPAPDCSVTSPSLSVQRPA